MNNFDFPEKKEIFKSLDNVVWPNSKLYLAVSWWPDSMFMASLLFDYFRKNNFNFDNLIFLYFDHWTREDISKEKNFLKEFLDWYKFIEWKNLIDSKKEKNLRVQRYNFFKKHSKDGILCLGHNLTDRIETTLLNMCRGSHLKWILNMDFFDKKNNILRPLIWIPKFKIQDYCDKFKIHYFLDKTNFDIKYSQRNYVRNKIIQPLEDLSKTTSGWDLCFYESFKNFYSLLKKENIKIDFKKIFLPELGIFNYWYVFENSIKNMDEIIYILDSFWVYKNVSQNMLKDLFDFFTKKDYWYKYLWWNYFFLNYWYVYVISWKEKFWEYQFSDYIEIKQSWKYNFFWYYLDIPDEFLWWIIRFPKNWDVFKNKTIWKYMINQKIPRFIRNYIPVVEKDWQIRKVFIYKI